MDVLSEIKFIINPSRLLRRESEQVGGLLLISFARAFVVVVRAILTKLPCKNPNRWIPASILGELKRRNNEDGTEKTYAIDKRLKDKCDERAD